MFDVWESPFCTGPPFAVQVRPGFETRDCAQHARFGGRPAPRGSTRAGAAVVAPGGEAVRRGPSAARCVCLLCVASHDQARPVPKEETPGDNGRCGEPEGVKNSLEVKHDFALGERPSAGSGGGGEGCF